MFDDDVLRHHIRVSLQALAAGMPVFFWGATGSGKTETALAIHRKQHPDKNFIAVDCASLRAGYLIGQLATEDGSAESGDHDNALDLASGGTIHLDEIGDLSPEAAATVNVLVSNVKETGQAAGATTRGLAEHHLCPFRPVGAQASAGPGSVAQISLRPSFPFPWAVSSDALSLRCSKGREAVQDGRPYL